MYNKNQKITLILMVILTILTVIAAGLIVKDKRSRESKAVEGNTSTQSQSQAGRDQIE